MNWLVIVGSYETEDYVRYMVELVGGVLQEIPSVHDEHSSTKTFCVQGSQRFADDLQVIEHTWIVYPNPEEVISIEEWERRINSEQM
jgi:hypothetical protein